MPKKKAPPVVSTDCSKLMSCLSFHRQPRLPPPPCPVPPDAACRSTLEKTSEGRSARRVYWERVKQLELELLQLGKWLDVEKSLIDSMKATACGVRRGECAADLKGLVRLVDGGYLHGIVQHRRPWERLVLQVSEPGIAEFGSNFAEVLTRMASVGAKNLEEFLSRSIPIANNITAKQVEQSSGNRVSPGSEADDMEAILLQTVEKLGHLALEGLRIQTESPLIPTTQEWTPKKQQQGRLDHHHHGSFVLVVLMQIRDGMEDYKGVGDQMIGLVETGLGFHVEGVHVAGMTTCMGDGDGALMWNVSLQESRNGLENSYCCHFVRNHDIALPCDHIRN